MKQTAGLLLLLALLWTTAAYQYGRGILFLPQGSPAVSVAVDKGIWVELGEGFPKPGVHQYIDELTPLTVIELTFAGKSPSGSHSSDLTRPLETGEYLSVRIEDAEIIEINRQWMSAGWRMVLAIPLRLDSMSVSDWQELPGIGPKLAERIETDRQKNGEFTSLADLTRVPGIGSKRLAQLEKYF